MGHLDVTAVAIPQAEAFFLVVSVTDDDGLPRIGLTATGFSVHELTSAHETAPVHRPVAAATEDPAGVYRLQLAPRAEPAASPPGSSVLAVSVTGATEGGWADDHGQTLTLGTILTRVAGPAS